MMIINSKEKDINKNGMTAPRNSLGLYIHVPFCVRKCNYCDFLSFGGTGKEEHETYFLALKYEIRRKAELYGNKYYVDSIFIGGGTPSLMDASLIVDLMKVVHDCFTIEPNAEISIESNPKTLTGDKLHAYHGSGINRLSIGAQSCDDQLLAYMGRVHTAEDFRKNYELARKCGFQNINIDLMFAIPGQTLEVWTDTLKQVLALEPEHISFYSLQIEEETPFYNMFREGSLKQTDDDLDREMYHRAVRMIRSKNYCHYEISNAAKDGFQCRHNLKYWSMEDYLGLGLGAHSFINGTRFSNTKGLAEYIRADGSCISWHHENTKGENISEFLFTGMRKLCGIEISDFINKFGTSPESLYGEAIDKFQREGLIEISGGHLSFTDKGIDISNRVLAEFV